MPKLQFCMGKLRYLMVKLECNTDWENGKKCKKTVNIDKNK